jgi:hypothetical protein
VEEKYSKALRKIYFKKYYPSIWCRLEDTMADLLFEISPKVNMADELFRHHHKKKFGRCVI